MLMDADYLFTESRLNRLFAELRCRADEDCQLLDCASACDTATQRCLPRVNDNVDVRARCFLTQ